MEKQKKFRGAFYAMIDCHDIDLIPSLMEFNNDDDPIIPVYVDKEYACALDVSKSMHFDDYMKSYEDIFFFSY